MIIGEIQNAKNSKTTEDKKDVLVQLYIFKKYQKRHKHVR